MIKIGMERIRFINCPTTVAIIRKCFGNRTFLIRLILLVSVDVDMVKDAENHVHGKRAVRRKSV